MGRGKSCPNNNEGWLKVLRESRNLFEAYRTYEANGKVPPEVVFNSVKDVEKYLDYMPQVTKYKGERFIAYGKDYMTYLTNYNMVLAGIEKVNNIYGPVILKKDLTPESKSKHTPLRRKVVKLIVNERALEEHFAIYEEQKEFDEAKRDQDLIDNKKELDERIRELESVEMPKDDFEAYEQRKLIDFSEETQAAFEKKKAIMLKTFPRVKEVIEDYTISQAGVLESNGTIVRVNPKYWGKDTIGHEFGHLLIDIMGGMSNPLVQKARKQLLGSHIETLVHERYKDLVEAKDGRIDKEVLAQAIGEETAKLFEDEEARSTWEKILNRIFTRLKNLLHIEKDAVKQLANMVMSGQPIRTNKEIYIDLAEQRQADLLKKAYEEKEGRKISNIEGIKTRALHALQDKLTLYKKKYSQDKINDINEAIETILNDKEPVLGIRLFQEFAISQTKAVYTKYAMASRQNAKYIKDNSTGKPFTLEALGTWKDYVSGFSLLRDFANLAESYKIDLLESNPEFEDLLSEKEEELKEAVRQHDIIVEAYHKEGLKITARDLSSDSHHIEAAYKEAITADYMALPKEDKDKMSLNDYMVKELKLREQDIKEETISLIEEELVKASDDINVAQRWFESPFHSSDVIGSTMAQAFARQSIKHRREATAIEDELLLKVKALEQFYKDKGISISNPKDMYSFMLELDSKGNLTQQIIDKYRSSLWDDYNTYAKKLDTDPNKTYAAKQELLKAWKKSNMPIDVGSLNKAKKAFYKDLIDKGIVTKQQIKDVEANDDYYNIGNKVPLDQIVSEEAAMLIHDWFSSNIWKHRNAIEKYHNPQFKKLVEMAGGDPGVKTHSGNVTTLKTNEEAIKANKAKDPRIDFYNFIVAKNEAIQKGVANNGKIHNRLPSDIKDASERLRDKQGFFKAFKHSVKESFNVSVDDTTRGDLVLTNESNEIKHFIPIHYATNIKEYYGREYDELSNEAKEKISKYDYIKGKADESQSYDLATIYNKYWNSAIAYKHKLEILPEMEFALAAIKSRGTNIKDTKGNPIKSLFGKIQTKAADNLAKQIEDWFKTSMYGEAEDYNGKAFWGTTDVGKLANAINKYTAINLLGVNLVAGTSNVILGSATQVMEAAAGDLFSIKGLARANGIYTKNLPGILADVGTRKPKNKLSLMLREFNILNEEEQTIFRKKSKARQLFGTGSLFFIMKAGEHFMQSKPFIASLLQMEAKDINGKVLGNMYDMFTIKDGKLSLDDRVANFTEQDQIAYEIKIRKKLATMHGDYSEMGRVAAQRQAAGRLAFMFRKFVLPGIKRRYQKKQVDNAMGEYVEGYYLTFGRFFGSLIKDITVLMKAMMSEDWKSLSDSEKANLKGAFSNDIRTLSPKDKANIKRAVAEISFLIMTFIAIGLLGGGDDDDEEADSWFNNFLTYQLLRFKTELLFFSPKLDEAMKLLRSPAAAMSVLENSLTLFVHLMPPSFEGFEVYERGSYKGQLKIKRDIINMVPVMKQVYRVKNIKDQISWLR